MTNQDRINELFEELVPMVGKADTVAGEIVRATCRIGYRWCNDGDQIGVEYGNETCNCAARYLIMTCDSTVYDVIIRQLWGCRDEQRYDAGLNVLYGKVLAFIDRNPGLKTTENLADMLLYQEPEDLEWDKEEEDEYEDDYDEAEGWY